MIKENDFLVYAILVYTADGPNLVVVQRVLGDVLALNIVLIKHYIKLNHFFVYRAHCEHRRNGRRQWRSVEDYNKIGTYN